MNEQDRKIRRLLASYLKDILEIGEASCLQILFLVKTSDQMLVMMDYLLKHKNEQQSEEYLCQVAKAISEQVK